MRAAALAFFLLAARLPAQTNAMLAAPKIATNLPLRNFSSSENIAPKFSERLPDSPALRPLALPEIAPLADAQTAVIRAPESWRNWAALALARYAAGDYEKAFSAARQMRAAAAAHNDPLPLTADSLFTKCKRAADALTLLE